MKAAVVAIRRAVQNPATLNLDQLADLCHKRARLAGWYETRDMLISSVGFDLRLQDYAKATDLIALFGLIMSEAGEAIDNVRQGMPPDDKCPEYPGAAVETADIIIRCLDLAGYQGWPIGKIVAAKMAKNVKRGHRHGGKLA